MARQIPDVMDYIPPGEVSGVEDGSGNYDCRPAMQRAIDDLGIYGGRLNVRRGFYRMSAVNGACLTIRAPVILEGEGYFSCLIPTGVGPEDDAIVFCPNPAIDCSQSVVRNIFIGDPSTGLRQGRHGVYLDTTHDGATLPLMAIRNLFIGESGRESICHRNGSNVNGGLFGSTIEHCQLRGGIRLDGSGDSNRIRDNVIAGRALGIYVNMVHGASQLTIADNNITSMQGAIRVDRGMHVHIERCNIEQINAEHDNDGAMINIAGTLGRVQHVSVEGCNLGAFTYSGIAEAIRIQNTDNAYVARNRILPCDTSQWGVTVNESWDAEIVNNSFGVGLTNRVRDAGQRTIVGRQLIA
jgi:hypothetical protein